MYNFRFLLMASIMVLFIPFQHNFSGSKGIKPAPSFNSDAYKYTYAPAMAPVVRWNSFLGGNASDHASAMTLDSSGNIYLVGGSAETWGNPVLPFEPTCCGAALVTKLDSSGNLLWNTFLGVVTVANYIAVDSNGNVYVIGNSQSTWGTPVSPYGNHAAFVAKLDSSGNLLWNTFVGETSYTFGMGIAVDTNGNAYITGGTIDDTWGNPVRDFSDQHDAFVAKLNTSGTLVWNTFLGGSGNDGGNGIELDSSGNIYVVGFSDSFWGSPIQNFSGLYDDIFTVKLDSSGVLVWNTFLNKGQFNDLDHSRLTVDDDGNAYIAGTGSTYGHINSIAFKLNTSGSRIWKTMLAGDEADYVRGITLDASGNVYVAGNSEATWGNPVEPFGSDGNDGFIARINLNGVVAGSTFIDDVPTGIIVGTNGNIYVAGASDSTWGNPIRAYSDNYDAFVAEVTFHIISGNAEIADVTLSYTDGTAKTTVTDSNGDYSFGVSDDWDGTVTASDSTHTFTPASRDYNNVVDDQLNQDYAVVDFFITGNAGIPDATLSYDNGGIQTVTADNNGDYTITVPHGWTGTITPSKPDYSFFPLSREYTNLIGDHINQNYNITGRKSISAGDSHTCGIQKDNTVYCWGDNYFGQSTPPAGSFGQISAGTSQTCGIKIDGTLLCWGNYYTGQPSNPAGTFTQVSAGDSHTCAVKTDATIACWGENYSGETIPPSGKFTQVSVGYIYTCGIRTNGTLACWGDNSYHQSSAPAGKFKQVSTDWDESCGLLTDHTLICWGDSTQGYHTEEGNYTQITLNCGILTDNTISCRSNDYLSWPGGTFTQISEGGNHVCAVSTNDLWACWGDNTHGQIYPYTITGTTGEPDVRVSYILGDTNWADITDANGNYSLDIPDGWSGAVRPSKTNYAFTPARIIYPTITSNQVNQDYTPRVTYGEISFEAIGTHDGWILESSENSGMGGLLNANAGTFQLGDDSSNRQYRAILSFNTTSIPNNANIKYASLWLNKIGTTGSSPFSVLGKLLMDIRSGPFGNSATLQLADFKAPASAVNVAAHVSNLSSQIAIGFNLSGRSSINKTGLTQLRLYFSKDDNNNQTSDFIKIISGNYGSRMFRPFLTIAYTMP